MSTVGSEPARCSDGVGPAALAAASGSGVAAVPVAGVIDDANENAPPRGGVGNGFASRGGGGAWRGVGSGGFAVAGRTTSAGARPIGTPPGGVSLAAAAKTSIGGAATTVGASCGASAAGVGAGVGAGAAVAGSAGLRVVASGFVGAAIGLGANAPGDSPERAAGFAAVGVGPVGWVSPAVVRVGAALSGFAADPDPGWSRTDGIADDEFAEPVAGVPAELGVFARPALLAGFPALLGVFARGDDALAGLPAELGVFARGVAPDVSADFAGTTFAVAPRLGVLAASAGCSGASAAAESRTSFDSWSWWTEGVCWPCSHSFSSIASISTTGLSVPDFFR